MLRKEIKVAKNATKLLGMCWDRNMSREQIHTLTKPIRDVRTVKEKEAVALKLIEELSQK